MYLHIIFDGPWLSKYLPGVHKEHRGNGGSPPELQLWQSFFAGRRHEALPFDGLGLSKSSLGVRKEALPELELWWRAAITKMFFVNTQKMFFANTQNVYIIYIIYYISILLYIYIYNLYIL